MTQEEKNLLLRDLCARLPYSVKCCISEKMPDWVTDLLGKMENCKVDFVLTPDDFAYTAQNLSEIKPYLRPMSSMTEKEKRELSHNSSDLIFDAAMNVLQGYNVKTVAGDAYIIDYLIAHHFDYRGLIEKGLALEAPEGMYKAV